MERSRAAAIGLAVLFAAVFLAALGLRLWASFQAAGVTGPDHIAAGHKNVFIHMNGEVYVLSAAGDLLARHALAPVMERDQLIDLRVLGNGNLLLARRRPAGLYTCEPATWKCTEMRQPVTKKLRDQFKVFPDERSGRLFVADFKSGVWLQPLAGGKPQALSGCGDVRGPNDLALDASGRLWIADSAGRQLAVVEPGRNGEWQAGQRISARTKQAREGRDWPLMLALAPDGNWWVTQPNSRGQDADLVVYHPDKGAVARIDLPDDAHPTDIARLGAAMLVTDMDRFRVYRVDAASHAVSEFGDAGLRDALRQASASKAVYDGLVDYSLIGMIVAGVLMLGGAVRATPKEKRWTILEGASPLAASAAPVPVLREIHWLKRNPKTEQMLRWVMPAAWASIGLIFAIAAVFYFVFGAGTDMSPAKHEKLMDIGRSLSVLLLLMVGVLAIAHFGLRTMMQQLGTDGFNLFVKLTNGRQLTLMPERLVYDARKIAYHDRIFPVRTGHRQALYEAGEIETYVAPLLARAKKLTPLGMFRYQLTHREPLLIASLVYAIIVVAVMTATGMWSKFLPI